MTFNLKECNITTKLKVSDLGFYDIEYVPLETKDQCLIPMINEIVFGTNYFLAHSFMNILMFRNDGTFVTKIGKVGRGPNEYTVVHDLDIDRKNQKIYLADGWQRRFYVYSGEGEFIRTFQTPINSAISFIINENRILVYNKNSLGNIENSYNLIDTSGSSIKKFPNKYSWNLKQNSTTIFVENLFYRFNNKLYKKEIYSDTVYVFEDIDFRPHLVIIHGDRLLTTKARSEYESIKLSQKYISQRNLFEFGDYFYYEFLFDSKIGRSNILIGLIGSKKDNNQFFIDSELGLINDLDGGVNICPKTIKDDSTIIGWIDALQLKTHVASKAFINSTPKFPEKKKELEKLANSLKETDNPVLMMVRLKN